MRIYVDFNNRDADGLLRLNNAGTLQDLSASSIVLAEGLNLIVSDGDLLAEIIVHEPGEELVWRGEIVEDIIDLP